MYILLFGEFKFTILKNGNCRGVADITIRHSFCLMANFYSLCGTHDAHTNNGTKKKQILCPITKKPRRGPLH